MGSGTDRHDRGGSHRQDEEAGRAEAEDGPVRRDPGVGIDGPYRAERGQRGEAHGQGQSQQRAGGRRHHRPQDAWGGDRHRAGPDRPQHLGLRAQSAQLAADQLEGDEEGGQAGDAAENAEGDRLGLDGPLGLGCCDADGDRGRIQHGQHCRECRDHRVDAGAAIRHLEAGARVVDTAPDEAGSEGGREDSQRRRVVGVVLHHLVRLDGQAHYGDGDDPVGLDPRGAESGQVGLGVGVDAHPDALADMPADRLGYLRVHVDLVGPGRVGEPALDRAQSILAEEFPTEAAHTVARLRR